jgi:uncharacterized damage-inducible protein DinB
VSAEGPARPGRVAGGDRFEEARTGPGHIVEPLRQSLSGDPWHGPSIAALLADVTPGDAVAHPVAGAHSIIELVLHLAAWTREVVSRLRGNPPALPVIGDWPPCAGDAGSAWAAARRALDEAHAELVPIAERLSAGRLTERIGDLREPALGTGVTVAAMLAGLAQHNAYHGGQIAILKRALVARRANDTT